MTPLRNNKSFLDSICSFKLGLFNAILEPSRILRIRLLSGAANKMFQENLWLKFCFKCFAGLESLEVFSCTSHRSCTLSLFHRCMYDYFINVGKFMYLGSAIKLSGLARFWKHSLLRFIFSEFFV